ncbi:hypothetical protein PIB30_067614 [Stylosanthes scabra]|uniref:Uncharacterized protein n=1 Tax=Stylosanthes scabra TaxID=79078 RepID=A0ABU6QML6_9FABA|nr:hypothetical protein [Stylosanthes scabra]
MSQINEGGETIQRAARFGFEAAIGSSNKTKMFDSFKTVSLGRDDSDNEVVECPLYPSQPSQPTETRKEVLQDEPEQQGKTKDAEVEVHGAQVEVPPEQENVVEEEQQPEPLSVIMPVQPQQDDEGKDLAMTETNEDPVPPIKVKLLQPELETSTAKGPVDSPDEIVTQVLLSMNQEESAPPFELGVDQTQPTQDDNQVQQLG